MPYPIAVARRLAHAGLAALVLLAGGAAQAVAPAAALAAQTPLRVMPLGDSLTTGVGSSTGSGYRTALHADMTAAGTAVDLVGSQRRGVGPDLDHEGHPGWRTDEIAAHLRPWLDAARPDVVLLDIGTNDLIQGFHPESAPGRTGALIDRITRALPQVRVVVAKLLVVGYAQDRFRRYNAALEQVVAARGPRVTMADMSRIPAVNTVDGVHPTDLGYDQMAYQWFRALHPGGAAVRDPFPLPSVAVTRAARAARGAAVTVTARLRGRLTGADLGGVPVRLYYRRAGTNDRVSLGAARTNAAGVVTFTRRALPTGYVTAGVVAGRADGRESAPLRIAG